MANDKKEKKYERKRYTHSIYGNSRICRSFAQSVG